MDNVYAFGVKCILIIQNKFFDLEDYFILVNNLADPNIAVTHLFPIISVFDSVFASEFLLITSVGKWINNILKWVLSEHRPYWWVKETRYYGGIRANKPRLHLGAQTCETGPGSPSGHAMSAASILALLCGWLMIVLPQNESLNRTRFRRWIKWISWFLTAICLVVVTLSRLFIATHFPHQCLLGIIFGFLTNEFVSRFWIAPFMAIDANKNASENPIEKSKYSHNLRWYMIFNTAIVVLLIAISFGMYWGQKLFGIDPSWSVKLAFKWCPSPDFLHFSTTPFYSLVETTGSILGWAVCVTPSIKDYRFNSENKAFLPLASLLSLVFQQVFSRWQSSISRDNATYFYLVNFFAFALRPFFFLRLIPFLRYIGQRVKLEAARIDASRVIAPKESTISKAPSNAGNRRKRKTN